MSLNNPRPYIVVGACSALANAGGSYILSNFLEDNKDSFLGWGYHLHRHNQNILGSSLLVGVLATSGAYIADTYKMVNIS